MDVWPVPVRRGVSGTKLPTPAGTPAEESPVREDLPARGKVSKEKPRPRVKVSTPKDRKNKNEKKVRSVPKAKKKDYLDAAGFANELGTLAQLVTA